MEFTKTDASAFARLHEGKRAQVRESRRLLEERSRQLMEQSALLKQDIDAFKNELATVGIHDYLTGVAHVCACAPLCPAVWSMLLEELLQHVFSRLPLPDIIRLRVLSKSWDKYVTGVTPGFTQLCAERNPNLFALISEGRKHDGDNGPMVVKLFDSKGKKWHRFVHETCVGETCYTMLAGDGGLVCVVSTPPDKEMEIVVFNPLTRQGRELPLCSSLSRIQARMVQLVVDRDSKCYKVLVVGPKKQGGGDGVARIFSSLTGEWSKPNIFSDLIFGCYYRWNIDCGHGMMTAKKVGPCAYECATSTLLELDDRYPGNIRYHSVFVKDRLFFLYCRRKHTEYHLNEYQAQSCQPHWVQVKIHECFEFDQVSEYPGLDELETQLFGCQDLLLVIAYYERYEDDEQTPKRTLLCDSSTSEWQIICNGIPEWSADFASDMFKLRWDAVP